MPIRILAHFLLPHLTSTIVSTGHGAEMSLFLQYCYYDLCAMVCVPPSQRIYSCYPCGDRLLGVYTPRGKTLRNVSLILLSTNLILSTTWLAIWCSGWGQHFDLCIRVYVWWWGVAVSLTDHL